VGVVCVAFRGVVDLPYAPRYGGILSYGRLHNHSKGSVMSASINQQHIRKVSVGESGLLLSFDGSSGCHFGKAWAKCGERRAIVFMGHFCHFHSISSGITRPINYHKDIND
jgi:hypothetical protein